MAFYYRQEVKVQDEWNELPPNVNYNDIIDFPPVHFSTFKPIPPEQEQTKNDTLCHARLSAPGETKSESMGKKKDTPPSDTTPAHKEARRKPGATLKEQTYQWFERTQRSKLVKKGHFPDWFHGFLTRNRAEDMLQDKPLGCFLIRFCESRVGLVLSYRGAERCRHFILNQLDDEQYVIDGEESTHPRLEDLIKHYCMFPVKPYKEILTTPCGKNSMTHDPSPGLPDNSPDAAAGEQMYGRIAKHSKALLDTAPLLSTSPKEKEKASFEETILVEYASSSYEEEDPPPSAEIHEGPPSAYTSVTKPSRNHKGGKNEEPSPEPTYTPPELHTYTEPELWTAQVDNADNIHDPIAFYAVGRGSCCESMENVYSEVDINSMSLHGSRSRQHLQVGFSTISHPSRKAFQHKPSAFHASLRLHKQPDIPQEDRGRGQGISSKHFPKSKTKPQAPLQFDDPAYGKSTTRHANPPIFLTLDDQENVYEKIPENCPIQPKKSHSARKES